ncbi:SIR2 family NAD-dependent protein deacylase [Photobacterium leiognathi]|uniref:SIR2 family NAD-dependent protein deacylase n=1 Tax=Photobacterium leiognathi TaxID=553611 RepID=UPI00298287CB|nr:hypothetical protein [Photobacterium leiognathi]
MRLIILSGAGLSVGSGLPTYAQLLADPDFVGFYSSSKAETLERINIFADKYKSVKPSNVHYELVLLERYCEAVDIDFLHYTLNVDNLIEQKGGSVHHLHGCITQPESIIENREVSSFDLMSIDWQPGDCLLVLGVSNTGYPLAALEAHVTGCGATFVNYNLEYNDDLVSKTIVGELSQTFSIFNINVLKRVEFISFSVGDYDVDIRTFSINGTIYEIFFSPSKEISVSDEELECITSVIGCDISEKNSFEVKFDLQSNRETGSTYEKPQENFSRRDLNLLGAVVALSMAAYANLREVDVYTASAVRKPLVCFYNHLGRKYAQLLNFEAHCGIGPEGVNYVFTK